MATKYFENKARRSFWSVHVEAWRRSGVSKRNYCGQHRLDGRAFNRWMRLLLDAETLEMRAEMLREERRRLRYRGHRPLSSDKRCRAVQAFWAMHVEAQTWSGLSARSYATAHHMSHYTLNKWRKRLETDEAEIDWRAHLHPSAWPRISTSVSASAKKIAADRPLTTEANADPESPAKLRRRSFGVEEKRAIVLETEREGATVSAVARSHRIVTSVLFRWRAELGFGREKRAKLVPVMIADGASSAPAQLLVLHDLIQAPDGMMAVDLGDGRRVFAPVDSDPEDVRRQAAAQEAMRC
jgi:transposase-like protein